MSPNNVGVLVQSSTHEERMIPDNNEPFLLYPNINIIRPIPRRVPLPPSNEINVKSPPRADKTKSMSTMIHPRLVQDFHLKCQEAGLTQDTIEAAVEESNEWHRKWTLQEEEGHTGPYQVSFRRPSNPPLSASSTSSPDEVREEEEQEGHYGPIPHYVAFQQEQTSGNPSLSMSSSLDDWGRQFSSPVLRPLEPALRVLSPLQLPARVPSSLEDEETGAAIVPEQVHNSVYPGLSPNTNDHVLVMDIESCKEALFHALAISQGDPSTRAFENALLPLCKYYHELGWDARGIHNEEDCCLERKLEGMWLTLTKASYFGSLGENNEGDPMYTLGRMAFDMFLPTQLVCSLQGNFNPVHIIPEHTVPDEKIPKSLLEECKMGNHVLRSYNILTAFTIEPHTSMADYPNAPNKHVRRPIKGIMTTFGFVLPDPQVPNRLSIWFTGGTLKPNNDDYDVQEWKRIFDKPQPSRTFGEKARVLAANLLMGAQVPMTMETDGTMEYTFSRPLGGHGVAYVDVIYLDKSLRIVRGHRGTLFVFTRIPDDASFQ